MARNRDAGPCPDPKLYILVRGENGNFWRRRRGSLSPAKLNESLRRNSQAMTQCSPLAKRVAGVLSPYTRDMNVGRLQSRLTAAFIKGMKVRGAASLAALKDFEFQPRRPLEKLVAQVYSPVHSGTQAGLVIRPWPGCVEPMNRLATGWFFEGIILYGDVNEAFGLRMEVETSGYYPFDRNLRRTAAVPVLSGEPAAPWPAVQFMFDLPAADTPYALLLRVVCLEGNELGANAMHYGLKVVGAG